MQLSVAEPAIPDLACACATLRRAARAVTLFYTQEFDGLLEGPQFSLLAFLNRKPGLNQAALVQVLFLDKTTISRNLSVLRKKGWIELVPSPDRRERGFHLTAAGRELLQKGRPAWDRAQRRLHEAIGDGMWAGLFEVSNAVTRAVAESSEAKQ